MNKKAVLQKVALLPMPKFTSTVAGAVKGTKAMTANMPKFTSNVAGSIKASKAMTVNMPKFTSNISGATKAVSTTPNASKLKSMFTKKASLIKVAINPLTGIKELIPKKGEKNENHKIKGTFENALNLRKNYEKDVKKYINKNKV